MSCIDEIEIEISPPIEEIELGIPGPPGKSLEIKGSVQTEADLPVVAGENELYVVVENGHGYLWKNGQWENLGRIIGTDAAVTLANIEAALGGQPVLYGDPRLSDPRPPTAHNHDTAYDPLGAAATAQAAAIAAAALDATGKVDALKDGVAADGDTLAKLRGLIQGIQTLLTSDNASLDTLQEVVDFVELHQSDLQALGAGKVNVSDIINALNDTSSNKPLSAAQGKVLKDALDALTAVVAGKQPAGNYVVDGDARLSDAREWSAATVDQAEAEAGAGTTRRAWTAQRVRQAIAAWWNTITAIENKTIGIVSAAAGVFTTLRATGQIRSDSSFVATAGTPVYLGNTEDASVAEVSSPSPAVLKLKTAYMDTLTVSALTGNKSHTPFAVDTTAGANYHLFQQAGVLKAITGSEASIFGTNPNNYGTYLYEGGAEYFISTNGGKVFRATPSGLWGYGDFSLGQAGARVAYLPNDSLTYEGRAYANYGMSAHPELVGLSGFNGVGLFAAGGLRSEVTNKGLKVYGSTNVIGGGSKIQRTIYGICSCELSPNEKVNGFKLKTTVPYGDNTFFTIRLHGYDYRAAAPIDLTVSLYNYSLGVIQAGASSAGGWVPTIRAANEGGALVLHFGLQVSDGYYAHFDVDATFFAMPADDARTEGWTFVDEPLTGTGQVTIPCVNRMADLQLTNSAFIAGKLNIGTGESPQSPNARIVASGTTAPGIQLASTSNGGGLILGAGGGGIGFYTYTGAIGLESYSERARIDGAGNLGLGVTPSAWSSSNKAFDIGIGGVSSDSSTLRFASNAYSDSPGTFKYKGNGSSFVYLQSNAIGHAWFSAPVGNAGDPISFTQAMTLFENGSLVVGEGNNAYHRFNKPSSVADGTPILEISRFGTAGFVAFAVPGSYGSTAEAAAWIGASATTSRSINAAGTINASGADYAEYERNNGLKISKGSIVGFKADGTLTLTYAEAIRFGIKSTNPSYVGGDVWGSEDQVGKRPDQPIYTAPTYAYPQSPVEPVKPAIRDGEEVNAEADDAAYLEALNAYQKQLTAYFDAQAAHKAAVEAAEAAHAEAMAQYEAGKAAFDARLEAARQTVDRIAYSGKVPVNVLGATPGGYIVAAEGEVGEIVGKFVADPDFAQYKKAVGRVNRILEDGRCEVAVIVH